MKSSGSASINIAEGSIRAGKTTDNIRIFARNLKKSKDKLHLATANTQPGAKTIIGDCDGLGLEHIFRGQCRWGKYKGNEALIVKGPDTNNKEKIVVFCGGGKADSYKRFRGMSIGLWIATEIDLHHENTIEEAMKRQVNADIRKLIWDLNPNNPNHPIYTKYIDKWSDDYESGKLLGGFNYESFNIFDNINITEQRIKEVISRYTEGTVEYIRDILGKRCVAEGLIYKKFANHFADYLLDYSKDEEEIRSGKKKQLPRMIEINIGLDFGGNKSAHALVATGITPNYQRLIGLASKRIFHKDYKEGIAPADVDKFVVEFVGFVIKEFGRCDYLEWDNEAVTLGTGVKRAVEKAYPQVTVRGCYKAEINDRIDLMQKLIGEDRFLYTRHCETLKEALKTAIWNPVPAEIGIDERLDDGTSDIDTLDGLEYTVTRQIKRFIQ